MFDKLDLAIKWLESLKSKDRRKDLSRVNRIANLIGYNQNSFKTVHIAGTNGKGSTATFISNILIKANLNVGLFVSPFIISFNERIQFNGNYISDDELLALINEFYYIEMKYMEDTLDVIPFFEATFIICLMYFMNKKVDIAVIECGIGGLLDATNIINPIASIITNVGYDHMNILGNTLEEIAYNKLGIVKKNGYLITTISGMDKLVGNYCKDLSAKCRIIHENELTEVIDGTFSFDGNTYDLSLRGVYQYKNAAIAIEFIRTCYPEINMLDIKYALNHTFHPGRFEIINDNPKVIIDGAHNISAVLELVSYIKKLNKDVILIFTALADKKYVEMLKIFNQVTKEIIFTSFVDSRAVNPVKMKEESKIDGLLFDLYDDAIRYAYKKIDNDSILLIAGSLHFVSDVRKNFLNIIKKISQ